MNYGQGFRRGGQWGATGAAIGSFLPVPGGTAIGAGLGAGLGFLSGIFGGSGQKSTPPDPNAPMYKYDPTFIQEMVNSGQKNIMAQAGKSREIAGRDILSQALRSNMLTSSIPKEQQTTAYGNIEQNMTAALANLYGSAAQMEQQGQQGAYGRYSDAYSDYIRGVSNMYQQQAQYDQQQMAAWLDFLVNYKG